MITGRLIAQIQTLADDEILPGDSRNCTIENNCDQVGLRPVEKTMTEPKIIIDESVSAAQFATFETFARQHNLDTSDCVFIKETHPGIPDSQILQHYLDKTTILLTTDRPFHNKVLARGWRSYYIDQDKITGNPLPGIRPKPDVAPTKSDLILKENYRQPSVEIRPLLLPASSGKLKKLRVKRRRIRNHFGGQDHLDQVAVTISWRALDAQTLMGIRVRISSNVGLKALDASESYMIEQVSPDQRGLVTVCHALVLLIQLTLQSVKTLVYYDAHNIDNPLAQTSGEVGDRYRDFFNTLLECFEDLEFVPTPKGKYVEKLRRKLDQLAHDKRANEIVPGNILEIIVKIDPVEN